ncbi:ThuA domain-containing protein [Porifericola rhodea]|uniref:ThuA domain-containing protein n=1 Tax=Porifericola rhodea TaxID=930972 RepID=UPI002665B8CB|nr:ThuA domain-containing protein [Porifericola rhodea]WKN30417.1 ThuA domain-containing protein [Porifericola rhodea]
MKKIITALSSLVLSLLFVHTIAFSIHAQTSKVLVFSKTAAFRHNSIETGIEAIRKLGEQHNFSIKATEDASVFTTDKLEDYAAIIFLNTTGDVLNDEEQMKMEEYIQSDGGYVGIHAAADTEYEWSWYGKLVGAYFNGHPGNPNVREATLNVLNHEHLSTEGLPANWQRKDEWYNYKDINEQNEVLIKIDESTYEGGTNGDNHPMAWYKEYDGGRAFYTGGGHTKETYAEPLFLQHLLGGIQYAMGISSSKAGK